MGAFLSANRVCCALERGILRLIAVDGSLHAFATPLEPPSPGSADLGLSLETVRFSGDPLNQFKTLSYLANLRLAQEASRRGLTEVVAPNERGRLSDGGRTTIFLVREGRVLTPPVAEGALPGIARRLLLEAGMAVEAPLDWKAAEEAEAVFLANALRGVLPVGRLEGRNTPLPLEHSAILQALRFLS